MIRHLQLPGSSKGQTKTESVIALSLLGIAIAGAWLLYRDHIWYTTQSIIGFFTGGE